MEDRTERPKFWRVIPFLLILLVMVVTGSIALAGAPASLPGNVSAPIAQGKGDRPQEEKGKPSVSGPANCTNVPDSPPIAPDVVLYDQLNNPGTVSTGSQQFEPANAAFNNQTADDFVVPGGLTWQITEVDAQGVYFNGSGPAASFNVYFYTSVTSGTYTIPGTPVYTATAQTYVNTAGVFQVTLSSPPTFSSGTYFVSVQARLDFSGGGQWGWTDRTVQANGPATWRNPGGGFGPGCVNWDRRFFCTTSPAGENDQMFRLVGNNVPATPTPTAVIPTPTSTHAPPTPTRTPCLLYYAYTTGSGAIIPGTTDTGNHTDDGTTTIALPFPYQLYDQTYSSANISSNGNIQFVSNSSLLTNACPLPEFTFNYAILPHWDDLRTDQAGTGCAGYASGCGVFTSITGTSPNRVFNIEWRTVYFAANTTRANFELRLYEGQTRFNIVYGEIAQTGSSATVGAQRGAGVSVTQFECNTAGTLTTGLLLSFTLNTCTSPTPTTTPTYTATATDTPTIAATACPIQFTDVPQGSTFYDFVRCLACRGIINGYSDGTFKPNNQVTRGQLSKIVSNAAGFIDPQTNQMFEDVPQGSTFYDFIGRLASRGYINGYDCGGPGEPCIGPGNLPYFRPNANATRGQISKIVSNAAGFQEPHTEQSFQDVPVGSTFYDFIERLASRGVIGGYDCGGPGEPCIGPGNLPYFRPNANATRGQTSKIVANTFFPGCETPDRR